VSTPLEYHAKSTFSRVSKHNVADSILSLITVGFRLPLLEKELIAIVSQRKKEKEEENDRIRKEEVLVVVVEFETSSNKRGELPLFRGTKVW